MSVPTISNQSLNPSGASSEGIEAPISQFELHQLDWDTRFFGSTMGVIKRTGHRNIDVPTHRAAAQERELRLLLAKASDKGYAHLILRVDAKDLVMAWAAERAGLRLVDIGVDSSFSLESTRLPAVPGAPIREGLADDIPGLCDLAADSFLLSRFSVDPFFSPEKVRDFHRAWTRNLCTGLAQSILVCEVDGELAGFVSCAVHGDEGRIPLIATRAGYRQRGLGRGLVSAALHWFAEAGTRVVRVKTQAHNYPALALYHRSGFTVSQTELTFSVIVGSAGSR